MAKYRDQYNYVNATLDASKIKFLSGTQDQLNLYLLDAPDIIPNEEKYNASDRGQTNKYKGAALEGAFYLTSDTHRLYIGRAITVSSATKIVPVPVNEGIETVASISALPSNANQGEFYYIAPYTENGEAKGNILAVRSGGNWVQLNTDTHIGSVASTIRANESSNAITDVDVRTTITDSNGNTYGLGTLEQWKLIPGNNVTFSYVPAVTTPGSEASARLTITAIDTTYSMGTETSVVDGEIKITPSGNSSASASSVHLVSKATNTANTAKNGDLSITSDNAGNVTFDLKEVEGVSVAARSGSGVTGFSISPIIDGTPRVDSTNGILDPTIRIGASALGVQSGENLANVTSGTTDAKFSGGIATLDIYTRLQTEKRIEDIVNQKIQVADALTYIGTASYGNNEWSYSDGTNSVTTFHKGDTFKVSQIVGTPNPVSGTVVQVGDLLIANGTEDSTGVITQTSLVWNVIPSGDEPVYSVAHDTTNKKTTLQSSLGSGTVTNVGSVTYAADDDWISSALTQEEAGNPNATITYSHKTKTVTFDINTTDNTTLSYAGGDTLTFLALDTVAPLTLDKGHVTGIKGKQVSIALNKLDKMYSLGSSYANNELGTGASALLSGAKINLKIQDKKSATPIDLTNKEIQYTSKTLMISGSTGGSGDTSYGIINVDLQWGTF